MMKKIVAKSLPTDVAFKYVQEVLCVGRALDDNSKEHGPTAEHIFVLAPEDTESAILLDFAHGGVLPPMPKISDGHTSVQYVPSTVLTAAGIVLKQLESCHYPTLWIHEPLLKEDALAARKLPHLVLDGAVYLVYTGSFALSRVVELIRYSLLSWHFLAFVTDGINNPHCAADLYRSATFVLIGAYDGESFLYLNFRDKPNLNDNYQGDLP